MSKRKKIFSFLIIPILVIGIMGFSYSYYEARDIRIVYYSFTHKDIPDAFDGKKIVFISDIHCNQYFTPNDVNSLVNQVNNLNPDFIFMGGDYTSKDSIYATPFFEAIELLKATHGIYSVMGNHDYWEDITLIKQGLVDAGSKICDNQSYWIHHNGDSIKIGGIGDMWEEEQILNNTINDVTDNQFCILLSHNPDFIDEIESSKVDLMLSGHTHGGQVTLFGLYAPIMPASWKPHLPNSGQRYRYGWKEKNGIKLYVTSGIGMGNFPFRFFAAPEIVEITLKKK